MPRRVVIHGHFYQPPREEPWLELVPRETSAAPDHDWNERITRECYAPLAWGRVLDDAHRIRRILNAYAWCSFDVGPTLWRWFEGHATVVRDAILAADRASAERLGHGNAMACPYHHVIMPLASRRDKVTEVRWGIRDFQRCFGRDPVGMWLPETAVDEETLEVLAEEGIRFTVLAPHQVREVPAWGRPGRWRSGRRELAIFVYDGSLAHGVAFGDLLKDAGHWADSILHGPVAHEGPTVTSLATDGETFGHHHRFGDLALTGVIDRLGSVPGTAVTNYAAVLAEAPPDVEVAINPDTSWSCVHGIERWRSNCGCRYDPETSQEWRVPLRQGLDTLATGIHAVVQRDWPSNAGDPWTTRDLAGPELDGVAGLSSPARRLLEAERHSLAMFTSCAWFFDDLARLEPRIVLRHAARALEFLPNADRARLEDALVATLSAARSNDPAKGNGADFWQHEVLKESDGPARLAGGIAAVRALVPDLLEAFTIPTHSWRIEGDIIVTHHRRTGREYRWSTAPLVLGVAAERVIVTSLDDGRRHEIPIAGFPPPVRAVLRSVVAPMAFDALLDASQRGALRDGLLDHADARWLALERAWRMLARDGMDDAGVLVHAMADLFALDEAPLTDLIRAKAFESLASCPATAARTAIADRFGLSLPESA